MKKFGIDISEWQDGFDFDKAVAEGVEFAILRGGDKLYKDRCFEEFYAACKQRGIPVGVYHYTRCTTPEQARQEAQFLIQNVLSGKTFEYPIYMDVEASSQKQAGKKQLTDTVIAYCQELEKAGYKPGVYTSVSFLGSYLDDSRLGGYERWIAQWYHYCQYEGKLGMWQFGGETNLLRSNQVAGVVCDQNYAYVDYPAAQEPEKPAQGTYTLEMAVLKSGAKGENVRAMQSLLMANGWDGGTWGADGSFGAQTQQAVTDYQKKKNLQVDGQVGPETMASLLGIA